jgi:hypothetical protein
MTNLEYIHPWTRSVVPLNLEHFASTSQSPRLQFASPHRAGHCRYVRTGHSHLQTLGLHGFYHYEPWNFDRY